MSDQLPVYAVTVDKVTGKITSTRYKILCNNIKVTNNQIDVEGLLLIKIGKTGIDTHIYRNGLEITNVREFVYNISALSVPYVYIEVEGDGMQFDKPLKAKTSKIRTKNPFLKVIMR